MNFEFKPELSLHEFEWPESESVKVVKDKSILEASENIIVKHMAE